MGSHLSRKIKIEWLSNAIEGFFKKRPKDVISKGKLLAEFALANASTERTGREILDLFNRTGRIKIEGDNITK